MPAIIQYSIINGKTEPAGGTGWLEQVFADRHVGNQYVGHILNCPMVSPLEAFAVRVGPEECARLVQQHFAIGRRRFVSGQQLIDLNDQSRQRVQPGEPGVVEHEPKEGATPLDAPLLAFIADARVLEECFVHAKESATNLLELQTRGGRERGGGGRGRFGHWYAVAAVRGTLILIDAQAVRPPDSHGSTPSGYDSDRRATGFPLPSAAILAQSSAVTDPRQLPTRPIEQVRERVIEALSEHFARDNLSIEDLETRMANVYAAKTPADVESLLDGLPALATGAPVPAVSEANGPPKLRERLIAVMSGIVRRGLWRIPRRLRVVAILGGVQLDLREAELPPGVTEIRAFVLMGGLDVRVPPGVRLETEGAAIMGGFEDRIDESGGGRDAPIVRITGIAIMGGVSARVQAIGAED